MIRKEFNEFRKEKNHYLKIIKNQIIDMNYSISQFKYSNAGPFQSSTFNEIELLHTQHIFRKDKT